MNTVPGSVVRELLEYSEKVQRVFLDFYHFTGIDLPVKNCRVVDTYENTSWYIEDFLDDDEIIITENLLLAEYSARDLIGDIANLSSEFAPEEKDQDLIHKVDMINKYACDLYAHPEIITGEQEAG